MLAAAVGGLAVALLIGVSRVVLGAHSVSEVLAGWLVGGTVSVATLTRANLTPMQIGAAIPAVLALWLAFMSVQAPASKTHEMVTRLALTLSGHKRPYTRSAMLHDLRRRQGAPAGAPSVTPPSAK